MSYNITKSDGTLLTTISDGTVDTTSTNLNLPGPNYVGYGQRLNENLIYLLENFASNSTPAGTNLQGQLWFNKSSQSLNVFTNQGFLPTSGIIVSGTQPALIQSGNLWFNTTTNQLFLYINGVFDLVGPQYTRTQGLSGAIPVVTNDASTTGVTHNILQLQYGNLVVATISTDPVFYPSPAITGFNTISPGLQFNSTIANTSVSASNFVGSLTGSVNGNVVGNVVGNVIATTLTGTLTGNVTATTVTASALTGQLVSAQANIVTANIGTLATNNLQVVSGILTGISTLSANTAQLTSATIANAQITSGNVTGLTSLSATTTQTNNLSTSNAQITSGNVTGLTSLSATTGAITTLTSSFATLGNLSTGNIQVTGGNLYNIGSITTTAITATSLTTSGAQVTAGNVTGLTNLSATTGTIGLVTTSNLQATSATIANAVLTNSNIASSILVNTTTATLPLGTSNTAIATTGFVQSAIPRGIILMWSGSSGSIPIGWALCDGAQNTPGPDLRGQFIVGAGGSYSVGDTGGASSVTLDATTIPSHFHGYTVNGNSQPSGSHTHVVGDPGHFHNSQYDGRTPGSIDGIGAGSEIGGMGTSYTYPTTNSVTGISLTAVGNHVHSIYLTGNTAAIGSSQPHENRPPYYSLCYIQKML